MANRPAVWIWYKDVLVSCADWDADVFGWYMRILFHQADKPGGISSNVDDVAALASVKPSQYEKFAKAWEEKIKHKFFDAGGGLIKNGKMEAVLDKSNESSESSRLKGKVGYWTKKMKEMGLVKESQMLELSTRLMIVLDVEMDREESEATAIREAEAIGSGKVPEKKTDPREATAIEILQHFVTVTGKTRTDVTNKVNLNFVIAIRGCL